MLKAIYNFIASIFATKAPILTTAIPVADEVLSAVEVPLTNVLTKQGLDAAKVDEVVTDILELVEGVISAHQTAVTHTVAAQTLTQKASDALSTVNAAKASLSA